MWILIYFIIAILTARFTFKLTMGIEKYYNIMKIAPIRMTFIFICLGILWPGYWGCVTILTLQRIFHRKGIK